LDKPTVIKVATFDGLEYTVNIGAKKDENYMLTVAVAGNFPKERAAVADEKPEDKAKAEKEFADNLKRLNEKLATESAFGKWTYQVATWTVDPLLKKRSELLEEKRAESKPDQSGGSPPPGA
jgi:MinD-like ATPase involved in chromosome partitioning or flagellar assembly